MFLRQYLQLEAAIAIVVIVVVEVNVIVHLCTWFDQCKTCFGFCFLRKRDNLVIWTEMRPPGGRKQGKKPSKLQERSKVLHVSSKSYPQGVIQPSHQQVDPFSKPHQLAASEKVRRLRVLSQIKMKGATI